MKKLIRKSSVKAGEVLEEEKNSKVSVQDLYRPVLKVRIPDKCPPLDPTDKWYIWWKEQIHRCMNGWVAPDGHYLNGYLYFYLNFVKVQMDNPETGDRYDDVMPPFYRDNDERIMNILWSNSRRIKPNGRMSNARNHIQAKGRGIAWTTFTLLGVALHIFVFRPTRPIGCSYPDDDGMMKERVQFQTAWAGLHPMFKRWMGKDLEPINNNKGEFNIGVKVKGEKIIRLHNRCIFNIVSLDTGAGVYRGDRLNFMAAVEAGKWKYDTLKNFYTENEASLGLGSNWWGMMLIGGTSSAIKNKSTAYKEMYEKPGVYRATTDFTPASHVMQGFIDYATGKSLVDKAFAHIMQVRDSKRGDPDAYQQDLMEFPLTPDDAFIPNLQLAYSSMKINQQISVVKSNNLHNTLWIKGVLEYERDVNNRKTGTVMFIPDEKGDWMLNREGMPRYEYKGLHIAAIDDTYKSKEADAKTRKEDSRNCMIIWRRPTMLPLKSDIPAGIYLGKNPNLTLTFEEFYKGMLFWDIDRTMYEYNADAFPNFLRDIKQDSGRLFYREGKSLPGMTVKGPERVEMTRLGSQFIEDGRLAGITHLEILHSLLIWGGHQNTDIGSTMHLLFSMLWYTKEEIVQLAEEERARASLIYTLGVRPTTTQLTVPTGLSKVYNMGRQMA